MRKSWPFAVAVIIVGGLAGVAIAGRPAQIDPFVLQPGEATTESTSTSVDTATTTTSESATTTTIEPTTSVPTSTSVALTVAAATAVPTTTPVPTTTETRATTIAGPLPRDQVRLVIANGDGRFRLASITGDRVRPLGYIVALGDAVNRVDATVVYYRPNFDDEAAFAAIDIGVPDAIIIAFPTNTSQPITDIDASGDVIIVLGPDAPR